MALNLRAVLGLDASGFELGIKRAQSITSKFTNEVRGGLNSKLGGFLATAAITAFVKKTIDAAGAINDMSERLNISTDAVQQWNFAATQAGGSAEKVTGFFEKLAEARDDALAGNAGKLASFQAFGVSQSDLKTGRLEDIGLKIGNAVKSGDAQRLISSLRDVGGKGAGALVAAFKSGLQEAFAGAPIISVQQIVELDALGDKMQTLGLRLQVAFAPVIMFLANGLTKVLNDFEQDAAGMGAFLGALAGGASKRDAQRAGYGAAKSRKEEQAKIAKALQDQIEAARNRGKGGSDVTAPEKAAKEAAKEAAKTAPPQGAQLNALQQIGGKVSFNPLQSALNENTRAVREAAKAFRYTPQTAPRNPNDGGVQYV